VEEEGARSVRVNVLSIIGATLAFASLAIPWFSVTAHSGPMGFYGRTFHYGLFTSVYGSLTLAPLLFVTGALVAFGSPAGGLLQVSGIMVYLAELPNHVIGRILIGPYPTYLATRIEPGTLIGLLAASIVLVSLLFPVWIDLRPRKMLAARFVTMVASASRFGGHVNGNHEARSLPNSIALANSICLAGAFLGVLCLALPWIQSSGAGSLTAPLGDFITGAQNLVNSPTVVVGALCFLAGSLLAMISVAGGLVQLVGLLTFLMGALGLGHSDYNSWQGTFELGAGFYLAITSTAIVAFSLLMQSLVHRNETGRPLGSAHWVWRRAQIPRAANGSVFEKGSRMNILGFIGASLGVIAIFLSWESYYAPSYAYSNFSQISAFQLTMQGHLDEVTICSALFIIGTVIALLTPFGGVIQIASSFWFLLFLQHSISENPPDGSTLAYGIGPFLGLLSGVLSLRSIWYPKWLELRSGLASASPRFFVVSMAPLLGDRSLMSSHRLDVKIPAKHSFFRSSRINAVCLAGAVSGLVACGLTWSPSVSPSYNLEFTLLGYGVDWNTAAGRVDLMFLLFFCGSIIALVSSLGSTLQVAGILGFVYRSGVFHGFSWEGGAATGFVLAIVSFILVVGSILYPWGPGNSHLKHTVSTRLLAWGGSSANLDKPPSGGMLN